ncbi:hypothetical protein [Paraburkholderia tuberum]|nr:hypothetical protein [Paraburkholderia tuberum]
MYSYQRFSSLKQAAGSSIERQSDYAAEWAATKRHENGHDAAGPSVAVTS